MLLPLHWHLECVRSQCNETLPSAAVKVSRNLLTAQKVHTMLGFVEFTLLSDM